MARKSKPKFKSEGGTTDGKFNKNKRNNTNRRRSNSRSEARENKEIESTNDPAWYSTSPELLRDAASIPFSWPSGTRLSTSKAIFSDSVPGVLSFILKPTIGSQMNQNSPVNVASNAIYTFVRHANSGHSNYDAPDLMMYIIAMSHVYSFVTWCQRLLGLATMYDQRNRYTPYALVTANKVDFEDLKNNLANFRYWLNNYITKVASLAVPATMPIFSRLAFLYSNVYIDGPSIKDQFYMYVPDIDYGPWMKFQLNETDQSGELVWLNFTRTGSGDYALVKDIIAYGNTLFNSIWDQEDFGIMSGDILKAYGDNIVKLSPVPVEFTLAPIYDTMVLHQMKNAKVAGTLTISKITQVNGLISQLITVGESLTDAKKRQLAQYLQVSKILSSDFESPGPDVVIESSRLMVGYDAYTNYIHTGTEVCTMIRLWSFGNNGVLNYQSYYWDRFSKEEGATETLQEWLTDLHIAGLLKAFKYAPEVLAMRVYTSGNLPEANTARIWDIDNYAVLDMEDIIKMHEAAMMSLYAVPSIAKIS